MGRGSVYDAQAVPEFPEQHGIRYIARFELVHDDRRGRLAMQQLQFRKQTSDARRQVGIREELLVYRFDC